MPDPTRTGDDLPGLGGDLAAVAAHARTATHLPAAADLRGRADRRQQRRTVTAAAAAVLAVAGGGFWLTQERPGPRSDAPAAPPAATASTAPPGITSILAGTRRAVLGVPGMTGSPALADSTGQVRAVAGDRTGWLLQPAGTQHRIRLAGTDTCMTVVHDAAPGSVRMRACDTGDDAQLFTVAEERDGTWSLFAGTRYVQVVDGTNALVPDLREGLTTTYTLTDAGPA